MMVNYKKKPRVKTIKDNIEIGDTVPIFKKDCEVGQWVDKVLEEKGHNIDKNGIIDLPEFGVDNKTRKHGSKCSHTVGSMTIENIVNTPDWFETSYHQKSLNQNQIEWSDVFQEVVDVTILDMDLPEIQNPLKSAYDNMREKVLDGDRSKNIKSDCGWAVFDGYNHHNSYRYRITDKAMKKIKNLSKSRNTRRKLFDE